MKIMNGNAGLYVRWGIAILGAGMWLGTLSKSQIDATKDIEDLKAQQTVQDTNKAKVDLDVALIQKDIETINKAQDKMDKKLDDVDEKLDKILEKL